MDSAELTIDQQEVKSTASINASRIFQETFAILEANTPHLRKRAHQVRFDVFGREKHWEDERDQAYDERDEYDVTSRHGLLVERKSGLDIGTVRVVIPGASSFQRFAMPIQSHVTGGLFNNPDIAGITCEASRFCVVDDYRRRLGELASTVGASGKAHGPEKEHERRLLPFAPLALIQFIVRSALEERRPVVGALMEPFLIRMLSQFEIRFLPVAPPVEFRGTRYPCVLDNMLRTLDRMRTAKPMAWQIVSDGGALHELASDIVPSILDGTMDRLIEKTTNEYRAVA